MADLRALLEDAAAEPRREVEPAAVLARGRVLARQRRALRAAPALLVALGLVASVVVPSGDESGSRRVETIDHPDPAQPTGPRPASSPFPSAVGSSAERVTDELVASSSSPPAANLPATAEDGDVDPGAPSPPVSGARPVLFVSNRDGNWEIYALASEGAELLRLTNHPAEDREPSWSPDGSRIAFVRQHDDGNYDIYTMRADGSDVTRLTDAPGEDISPTWSPDGSMIAFTSDRTGRAVDVVSYSGELRTIRTHEVHVMAADGSGQRRVMSSNEVNQTSPTWSPDGRRLAYVADDDETITSSIWVVDLDGTGNRRVYASGGFDREPAWSPDGARLAFRIDGNGSTQIHLVDVDGTDHRQLTSEAAAAFLPAWSPDGSRILFSRDVDGPRYRVSDSTSAVECAAVREYGGNPADVCPSGPAPSEIWSIAVDGTGPARVFAELADAVDPDA